MALRTGATSTKHVHTWPHCGGGAGPTITAHRQGMRLWPVGNWPETLSSEVRSQGLKSGGRAAEPMLLAAALERPTPVIHSAGPDERLCEARPPLGAEDGPPDKAEMDNAPWRLHPGPLGTRCQLSSPGASGGLARAEGGVGFRSFNSTPSQRHNTWAMSTAQSRLWANCWCGASASLGRLHAIGLKISSPFLPPLALLGATFPHILPFGFFNHCSS